MLKKIVRVLIAIIAIAMIAYIVVLKWPKATVGSKAVEVEVSAQKVYNDYTKNENAAQTKYFGKVILVSGIIDEKYSDEDGAPVVILREGNNDPAAVVTLESNQASKLKEYGEGDAIKIKAQCSGMLIEVTFSKGVISE